MGPPKLTPEQRARALEKAAATRRARAAVKRLLKEGEITLSQLFERADRDEMIGGMKVDAALTSLPGLRMVFTFPKPGPRIESMGVLRRSMSTILAMIVSPTSRISGMTMSDLKGASIASWTFRNAFSEVSMSTSQRPRSMSMTSPMTRSPERGLKPASREMTDTIPRL